MKITGEKKPIVGVTEMYSVIDSDGVLFTNNTNNVTYAWYIFKKYKNGAFVNVTKNNVPKIGQTVPYSFGYNVEYRLDVYKLEKELLSQKDKASFVASYFVTPTKKGSKSEIKKVVLYNKGAKNVDLAGIGNSLTVRVECINMINKQVKVHVWNVENKSESNFINADIKSEPNLMNSRLIDINEKGIGLTQFNVMQLLSPSDSMDLMIGNKKAIGFYVTATYEEQSVTNKAAVVVVSQYQSIASIFENARSVSTYNDIDVPETSNDGKCPNCEKDITVSELQQIYPKATDSRLKDLAKIFNKYKKHYKLDTCARKAHFFAQSIQEVSSDLESGVRGESFNYYKDNLAISLKAFETEEGKRIAQTYGRKETSGAAVPEANQIVLANYAYGYQYDTGKNFRNTGKNDGWNFRGRGLLQITGRSNYEAIQKRIDKFASDENVNIFKKYDSPNKAISIDDGYMSVTEATLTGMADWYKDDMFVQADKTGTKPDDDVVDLIVNIINKYTPTRPARQAYYQKTKATFVVNNCKNINKKEDKIIEKGECVNCNEGHYDLADINKWQSQFSDIFGSEKKQRVACWRACKVVLSNYKVNGGDNVDAIQMVKQDGSQLKIINSKDGKKYIDTQLKTNKVVLVGVDDGRTESYNTDDTTEHFLVIVGKGCENGAIFYRYFDVGTKHISKGTNLTNKLYLKNDGKISGNSPGGNKIYTIAQVRRNK